MNLFNYDSPFSRFMMRLVDIIVLSFLTLLCCLPIITIGAAFSALYYVLLKMVRDTDNSIVRSYFKAFKDNFVKGTLLWIVLLVILFVLYMDFYLLLNERMDHTDLMLILILIMSAIFLMVGNYIFPMQAQFENSVWGTIKKSFLVCVMNLPRSLLLLLIMVSPLLIIVLLFPEMEYFLPFVYIAPIPYLKTQILVRVFDRYMPKNSEGDISGESQ